MAHPAKGRARFPFPPMVAWAARHRKFDQSSRTERVHLAMDTKALITTLIPPQRAVLPAAPRRLPQLLQLLRQPRAKGRTALPLPSAFVNGRTTTISTLSHPRTMRSVRSWRSPIAAALRHRLIACRRRRSRATVRRMGPTLVASMTATIRRRQPTILLRCHR